MDEADFPTALPDDPPGTRSALGWMAVVLALATLLLAVFNAHALAAWAEDLPATRYSERLVAAADAWRDVTDRYALGTPRAQLHTGWKQATGPQPTPRD